MRPNFHLARQESQASSTSASGPTTSNENGSNEGNRSGSDSEEDVLHIDAGPEEEEFDAEADQQNGNNSQEDSPDVGRAEGDNGNGNQSNQGEAERGDYVSSQGYPLMALRAAFEARGRDMSHITRRGRRFFGSFPRPNNFLPRNSLGRGIPLNPPRVQNGHGPPPTLHFPTTRPRYLGLRQAMRDRLGPPVVHQFDIPPATENTQDESPPRFGASQAAREVTPPANHVIPPEMPALERRRVIVTPNNSRVENDPALPRVRELRLASAETARSMVVDQGPHNTPRTLTQLEEQTRSLFQAVDRRYSRFPPRAQDLSIVTLTRLPYTGQYRGDALFRRASNLIDERLHMSNAQRFPEHDLSRPWPTMLMDETSEDGLYRWTRWIFQEMRHANTNELRVVRMGLHRYRSGYFALDGRTVIIFESFREHSGNDIPHSIGHLVPWLVEMTRGTRAIERMLVRRIHIATEATRWYITDPILGEMESVDPDFVRGISRILRIRDD